MTEFQRLQGAIEHIDAAWDRERHAAGLARLRAATQSGSWPFAQNNPVALYGFAAFAAVVLLLAGSRLVLQSGPRIVLRPQPAQVAAVARAASTIRFSDGSQVAPIGDAKVEIGSVADDHMSVFLRSGAAQFSIQHRPSRTFEVDVGFLTVAVLGTEFEVNRLSELKTRVSVVRGRVAVRQSGSETLLTNGESAEFTDLDPAIEVPVKARADASAARSGAATPTKRATAAPVTSDSWRELARRGDYKAAHQQLQEAPHDVRDQVQDLLLAADAARLSGHPASAVPLLERAVSRHPGNPQTVMAAFTLGRVSLQLGQPAKAAVAFARCQSLAPNGSLAEDALAREVQALAASGNHSAAKSKANGYLLRYPNGRRRGAVLKHSSQAE